MTNREVYLADLDPFDPNARFQILNFTIGEDDGGGWCGVTWTSRPTRAYRLLFNADLKHWEAVGPSTIIGKDGETVLLGSLTEEAPLSKTGSFRVEVLHPLEPVDDDLSD